MLSVLVADDSLPSLAACQAMLEKLGHTVCVAHNGSEALEKAETQVFDLIILDEYMPGLGGSQVAQLLRSLKNPNIMTPIVSLSGVTLEVAKQQMLESGINAHLNKPISLSDISVLLAKYVVADSSAIDSEVISAISADLGQDVFTKLLMLFAAELEQLYGRLSRAVVIQDVDEIAAVTHIWKNSASLYGAHHLADTARKLNEYPPSDNQELIVAAELLLVSAKDTWKSVQKNVAELVKN